MAQTNYELYSYARGRWTLHARYPASGKTKAVNAAESLFQNAAIAAVSVIEERLTAGDSSSEYTIFSDAKNDSVPNLRGRPVKPADERKSRRFEYSAPAAPEPRRTKSAKSPRAKPAARTEAAAPNPYLFTGKVIGVIILGVVLAWGAATALAMIDNGARAVRRLRRQRQSQYVDHRLPGRAGGLPDVRVRQDRLASRDLSVAGDKWSEAGRATGSQRAAP